LTQNDAAEGAFGQSRPAQRGDDRRPPRSVQTTVISLSFAIHETRTFGWNRLLGFLDLMEKRLWAKDNFTHPLNLRLPVRRRSARNFRAD